MKKPERSVSSSVDKAVQAFKKGGIVIFPTDTVFGIGSIWNNENAKKRLYKIKSRPTNLPFPLLIEDLAQLEKIAVVTPLARKLIERYWPGGLTIVLNLKGKKGTIGFRKPKNKLNLELIKKVGKPIIGTSANLHGEPSVKNSADLNPKLISQVDYVLQGECQGGVESTVIDLAGNAPKIIRQGAVKVKSITLTLDTVEREKVKVTLVNNISGKISKLTTSQQTGSQALIPSIVAILKKDKADLSEVDAIEVNPGPGSFTGTRVGVAVANALGFALGIPVNGKIGKIAMPVYEKSKFD